MANIGEPKREIYVEPVTLPVPQREVQQPAQPAPAKTPEKVPA